MFIHIRQKKVWCLGDTQNDLSFDKTHYEFGLFSQWLTLKTLVKFYTLAKPNSEFTPKNGWLGDDPFPWSNLLSGCKISSEIDSDFTSSRGKYVFPDPWKEIVQIPNLQI